MALSFESVQIAYKVLNDIKKTHIPDLNIPSFPEDIHSWDEKQLKHAKPNLVYGCDRKYDNGWENLFFYTKNPSLQLKYDFEKLAKAVPNSSISRYDELTGMWEFGWF